MLSEWYLEVRLQDTRFYKLWVTQVQKPPDDPGEVFPSLKQAKEAPQPVDDDMIFYQVVSSLNTKKT